MEQLVEFWKLASKLKDEPRRGWMLRLHVRKIESVADHSFGVAILSLYEAERRGYDIGRVLKLALIHDLEEAMIGDLTPTDKWRLTRKGVLQRKASAKRRILSRLPPSQRSDYQRAWKELGTGGTREARLVKDLDKFEMALQAREYESKGAKRAELEDFYRSARKGIKDRALKKTLGKIIGREN